MPKTKEYRNFTIEQLEPTNWSAITFEGGPESRLILYFTSEAKLIDRIDELYSAGKIPANAIAPSVYDKQVQPPTIRDNEGLGLAVT